MLNVIILSVIVLSVIMLTVVMLIVVMLSVVVPSVMRVRVNGCCNKSLTAITCNLRHCYKHFTAVTYG
jgi:hypothetical protein